MTKDIRVPAGPPTGGQFAAHARADGEAILGYDPDRSDTLREIDKLIDDVYPDAAILEFEDYADSGGEGLAPHSLLDAWAQPIVIFDGDEDEQARALGERLRGPLSTITREHDGVSADYTIELHHVPTQPEA